MNRRKFLSGLVGAGAAGLTIGMFRSGGKVTVEKFEVGVDKLEKYDDIPERMMRACCYPLRPKVTVKEDRIVICGCFGYGSSGCDRIGIKTKKYDSSENKLVFSAASFDDEGLFFTDCQLMFESAPYRAELSVDGEVDKVVAMNGYDGDEVVTKKTIEPSARFS